jgi:16S rRNA (uracil1498-N3)-methyltransferase
MRRFFVPPELSRDAVFELPEREARHAAQVLRLEGGDPLTVLDGAGGVLRCVVESATKRSVRVAVQERRHLPPLPVPLTLIQAVPKGPAFDDIVQKATELGASRIIPLLSERVVAHLTPDTAEAKVEKWRQIAIESVKQCGSPWLPVIEKPVQFAALLPQPPHAEFAVVSSLEENSRTLREAVESFSTANSRPPANAAAWIGPEGDFTPAEYRALAECGVIPMTLGPLVLRADTAAIATLALLNYELQPRHRATPLG